MTNLEALIFDVDGTLADTEDAHRIAFNRTFHEHGLDWHWDQALYHKLLAVTGGKERILHYINQYHPPGDLPDDLTGYIAQLHADKTRCYTGMLAEGKIPLRPGVKRLLTEAHDTGMRLAIATTTSPANVEALIHYAFAPEVMGWFEVISAGDSVKAKKPAPDIYLLALQQLALAPQQCLALEDSGNGILSARAAGLETVITTNAYTHDHSFDDALIVLDQFGEPDQPFTVLQGDAHGKQFLDLALLRKLHASVYD